jgi:hypothetical protein
MEGSEPEMIKLVKEHIPLFFRERFQKSWTSVSPLALRAKLEEVMTAGCGWRF